MKIVWRVLAGVVVLIVVVVVAGVVALMTIDPNEYRERLTAEIKEATGRELIIKGDLAVGISLIPTIVANDVSFSNAPWGSRREMATIKRLETNLQILPLLSGDIRMGHIVLVEPNILLEVAPDGRANWEFTTGAADSEAAKKAKEEKGGPPTIPNIETVSIEKGTLRYRDQKSKQDITLTLDDARVDGVGADSRLKFDIAGAYNKAPFKLKGSADALALLLANGGGYALDAEASAFAANARVKGTIGKVLSAPELALELALSGKDLNATLAALKAVAPDLDASAVPALGGFEISGKATGAARAPRVENLRFAIGTTDALKIEGSGGGANGTYALDRFTAKIKGSDVGGSLTIATGGKVPDIKGNLAAKHFDVADLTSVLPKDEKKESTDQKSPPVKSKAAAKADDGRVFSADPLPLDGLKAANAQVAFKAGQLVVDMNTLSNVDARLNLKDGKLIVDPLTATMAEGRIGGRVGLDAAAKVPAVETNLTIEKINVGQLLKDREVTNKLAGKVDTKLNVRGTGSSVRALMASLTGTTEVILENGQLQTGIGGAATGDLLSVVASLGGSILTGLTRKPAEPGVTKINCFVSRFDIKQGIATSTGLLFDTDKVTVAGEGTVDLRTEKLDLKLKPEAKGGITIDVAPVVEVTGTIADPRVAPSNLSILKGIAGAALIAVNPVALLATAARVGMSDENPCVAALDQKGQGGQGQPQQPPPSNPVEGITRGVQDTFRSIFGGGSGK